MIEFFGRVLFLIIIFLSLSLGPTKDEFLMSDGTQDYSSIESELYPADIVLSRCGVES